MNTTRTRPARSDGRASTVAFASIWLVFLFIPTVAVASSGAPQGHKLLAYAGLALFALVYVAAFREPALAAREPAAASPASTAPGAAAQHASALRALDRRTAAFVAVELVLAALIWPAASLAALSLAPYFAALLLFHSPMRRAPWIVGGVVAAGAVVALLSGRLGEVGSAWAIVGPGIGVVCVFAGRLAEHASDQRVAAQRRVDVLQERHRISRDVHDLLGHSLSVLAVKSELASRLVDADPARARAELEDISRISREALAEVRSTVTDLRSPDLASALSGARAALQSAGIRATVRGEGTTTPHAALFAWALREAVTNVLRHSGARRCEISIQPEELSIVDDGVGLDGAAWGNGLEGLRSRVESAGGQLELAPGARTGTRLTVRMEP
ncbi:sensor histidine kinase [Falsarthrobacter nasiphocae]|uniref:Two-component system sensor histidine kinase DesK n=1 Tax=Falsarthrobacter nasiphocae TaxID=189863 RepID=A0AAE3YGU7_9MICC|nr:sensor histidine kinase [Falsarthrobacter nasiphocae]MDR6891556.1 two-component system sensor histidine kinase DesK [Falsarthrobacter nasiphocae]